MVSSLETEKRDADQRFLRAVTWMPVCSKGGHSSGRLGSTSQSPHRIPVTQVLRRLKKYYISKNSSNLIIKLSPFFAKHLLKDFRTYRVRFCKMLFVTVMWPINLFCFGEDLKCVQAAAAGRACAEESLSETSHCCPCLPHQVSGGSWVSGGPVHIVKSM